MCFALLIQKSTKQTFLPSSQHTKILVYDEVLLAEKLALWCSKGPISTRDSATSQN